MFYNVLFHPKRFWQMRLTSSKGWWIGVISMAADIDSVKKNHCKETTIERQEFEELTLTTLNKPWKVAKWKLREMWEASSLSIRTGIIMANLFLENTFFYERKEPTRFHSEDSRKTRIGD